MVASYGPDPGRLWSGIGKVAIHLGASFLLAGLLVLPDYLYRLSQLNYRVGFNHKTFIVLYIMRSCCSD